MKPIEVYVQNDDKLCCPDEDKLVSWVNAALLVADFRQAAELTLRIVSEEEMTALNQRYRDQPGSTNVLSFPAGLPAQLQHPLLGDVVICSPVVESEAREQGKTADAHWAHMVVHGSLHLLGFDHIEEPDATAMEQLETTALDTLQFAPPYQQQGQPTETSKHE